MVSITQHPDGRVNFSDDITIDYSKSISFNPPVAWQLCPKCGGEGKILLSEGTAINHIDCPVCKGKMIINLVDGKPPKD